jgi:hypothetical protein
MSKQHKTLWTVTHLRTGGVLYFETEEGARAYSFTAAGPVSIRRPIYG